MSVTSERMSSFAMFLPDIYKNTPIQTHKHTSSSVLIWIKSHIHFFSLVNKTTICILSWSKLWNKKTKTPNFSTEKKMMIDHFLAGNFFFSMALTDHFNIFSANHCRTEKKLLDTRSFCFYLCFIFYDGILIFFHFWCACLVVVIIFCVGHYGCDSNHSFFRSAIRYYFVVCRDWCSCSDVHGMVHSAVLFRQCLIMLWHVEH